MICLLRRLAVVAAVLIPLTGEAHAQTAPSCFTNHLPSPNSPYAYAEANLIGLRYALSAWSEGTAFDQEKDGLAPTNLMVAMMRHTKQASEAYACASQVVLSYQKSSDKEGVGAAAGFVVAIYDQHRRLNDLFLESLRSLSGTTDMVKLADVLSTLQVERGKTWTDLTRAITLSVMLLMDRTKTGPDGNLNAILLTRVQSDRLLAQIQEDFPGVASASTGASTPTRLANLYYGFLKRPLKRADE
jgi:hypothetical protein